MYKIQFESFKKNVKLFFGNQEDKFEFIIIGIKTYLKRKNGKHYL